MSKRCLIISLVTVFCFLIMSGVYVGRLQKDYETLNKQYEYMAKNEADHIITTIDCIMARINTLEALVQDHYGDTDFFEGIAENVYTSVKEETGVALKNVALAPNGVVSNVYPYEGNKNFIGFDYFDSSKVGNKEALEAFKRNETILTNPFELVQGGVGMAGRTPVMIKKGDKEELWGLVSVTIDYDNMMKELKLSNFDGMGVLYELSFIDDFGEKNVLASNSELSDEAIKWVFNVRNLTWEIDIEPENGWINVPRATVVVFIFMIIALFLGQFLNVYLKLRETNKKLLRISNVDTLTGFYNRRAYEEAILRKEEEKSMEDFIYASVDINGLKGVNDTYGHQAGDRLIVGAADCLKECFGDFGSLYRIGGDEFAVMFEAGEKSLEAIKESLTKTSSFKIGNLVYLISFSIGYASKREFPDKSIFELAKIADKRMYDDKRLFYQNKGIDRRK